MSSGTRTGVKEGFLSSFFTFAFKFCGLEGYFCVVECYEQQGETTGTTSFSYFGVGTHVQRGTYFRVVYHTSGGGLDFKVVLPSVQDGNGYQVCITHHTTNYGWGFRNFLQFFNLVFFRRLAVWFHNISTL